MKKLHFVLLICTLCLTTCLAMACTEATTQPSGTDTQPSTTALTDEEHTTESQTDLDSEMTADDGTSTESATTAAGESSATDEVTSENESDSIVVPTPEGGQPIPTHLYNFSSRFMQRLYGSSNCDLSIENGIIRATVSRATATTASLDLRYGMLVNRGKVDPSDIPNMRPDQRYGVVVARVSATSPSMVDSLVLTYGLGANEANARKETAVSASLITQGDGDTQYVLFNLTNHHEFRSEWINVLEFGFTCPSADGEEAIYLELYDVYLYKTMSEAYEALGQTYVPETEPELATLPELEIPAVDPNATPWTPTELLPADGASVQTASTPVVDLFTDFSIRDSYSLAEQGDVFIPLGVSFSWANTDAVSYRLYISTQADMSDPYYLSTTEPAATVRHLYNDTRYYWQIIALDEDNRQSASPVYTFTTLPAPRACAIEGVSNVRDLGGSYLTENTRIRQGLLYRAAHLDNITPQGIHDALYLYGIRTELDLRRPGENTGGSRSPLGDTVRYFNISGLYYDLREHRYQFSLANEIAVLADPNNYPVMFHCAAGRDRTGTLAFLIGALLGQSKEQLYLEYELTFLSIDGCSKPDGDYRHVHEMYMHHVDRMYNLLVSYTPNGGTLQDAAAAYMRSIGVTDEQIQSIRDILIEEIPA